MVNKLDRREIVSKINDLSSKRMSILSAGYRNLSEEDRKKEQEIQNQIDSLVDLIVELENE